MSYDNHPPPAPVRGMLRLLYIALGLVCVGLAVLGVSVPLLPTTPLVLLASFFFIRSSPRLNSWLLRSRVFGPFLRDWQQHRAVRPHVKFGAVAILVPVLGVSAFFGNLSLPVLIALLALGGIGLIVVLRLPVIRPERPLDQATD